MPVISREEFEFIQERLNSLKDIDLIHERLGLPNDMLLNILAKKITRDATKRYYRVKKKTPLFLKKWKKGESICRIAEEEKFPPALIAMFLLEGLGYSKKRIKEIIKNPSIIIDSRLRKEVEKAVLEDFVYSPSSSESQAKNGRNTEDLIEEWLKSKKASYITEVQAREEGASKTPDFLLKKPIKLKGKTVHWVESKASFGDDVEIRKNYRQQLSHYVKLFGTGAVIYWYGYVEKPFSKGFIVLTREDVTRKT